MISSSENLSAISEETSASSEEISSVSISQTEQMKNLEAKIDNLKKDILEVNTAISNIKF